MSKRFKAKTCVYCGAPNASQTEEHVFARQLFPKDRRANLPKVAACEPCNRAKADLEHYLVTVLPFAGRHPEAHELLVGETPRRLARNFKLQRELKAGQNTILIREGDKTSSRMTLPFQGHKLNALFRLVLRGLAAHHWEVLIPQGYFVGAGLLTPRGEAFMRDLFLKRSRSYARANLGDGLVLYEGVQALDNPAITIWRFQLYGGILFGGETAGEVTSNIWAVSGPTPLTGLFD